MPSRYKAKDTDDQCLRRLGLLTRIALILTIVSEILVIVGIAINTYRRKTRQTQSFVYLVLRDGALYFLYVHSECENQNQLAWGTYAQTTVPSWS